MSVELGLDQTWISRDFFKRQLSPDNVYTGEDTFFSNGGVVYRQETVGEELVNTLATPAEIQMIEDKYDAQVIINDKAGYHIVDYQTTIYYYGYSSTVNECIPFDKFNRPQELIDIEQRAFNREEFLTLLENIFVDYDSRRYSANAATAARLSAHLESMNEEEIRTIPTYANEQVVELGFDDIKNIVALISVEINRIYSERYTQSDWSAA